jgi:hypothetical protein
VLKRAIIVVALQKDYLTNGSFALVGIDEAAANAARVIEAARSAGDKVIHIRHENSADAPFFVPATNGAEIIPTVAPAKGELVITKNYPNSFRETELKQALDAEGIQDVVVVGAMSHMCIDATSRAAADLGYSTTIVAPRATWSSMAQDGSGRAGPCRLHGRPGVCLWQGRHDGRHDRLIRPSYQAVWRAIPASGSTTMVACCRQADARDP